MCTKQRLVVCLDGTWNNQDDSTNVLQHFALALNGSLPDGGIKQNKHYIAGVSTGVLDRISGGGFAFGLEENVRAAYDWLVANYSDDRDPANADEIYIFGFSRGAYTARSLVGFISTCGLLRLHLGRSAGPTTPCLADGAKSHERLGCVLRRSTDNRPPHQRPRLRSVERRCHRGPAKAEGRSGRRRHAACARTAR